MLSFKLYASVVEMDFESLFFTLESELGLAALIWRSCFSVRYTATIMNSFQQYSNKY